MSEPRLTCLLTPTPQSGWELAVKLTRMGVKITQPSEEIRKRLRVIYEDDADSLIAASQVMPCRERPLAFPALNPPGDLNSVGKKRKILA
jgi:hypothetical protein